MTLVSSITLRKIIFFSNLMIPNCLFKFFYCLYAHLLPKMSQKLFPIQKFAEKILVSREQLKMIFLVLAFIKFMERALVKKSASKFMNLFRLIVIVWTRWDFKNQNSKFFQKKVFSTYLLENSFLGSYLCKNGRRYRWSFLSSSKT